ncbi:MAG: dTDP-4-dehydrorhamnose reductase [Luteimonas sp.]
MNILLLGANGQVGHALRQSLAPLGKVILATRNGRLQDGGVCEIADFDRTDALPALVARIAPDVVVNAAAYTAVDRAEDEPEAAFRANAEAPRVLAQACAARDALLVHYSTDYVFDGTATRPYREDDPTAPLGIYGASKLAGEEAVRTSDARHIVLRTAWVYAAHGKNFLRTILRLAGERDELRVVADQIGTPTSAALIAETTRAILATAPTTSGLWHLTAEGSCSWYGFAEAIVARAQGAGLLERTPRVVAIDSEAYSTRARRPAYSCLDTTRIMSEFGVALPSWTLGLDDVLAELALSVKMR